MEKTLSSFDAALVAGEAPSIEGCLERVAEGDRGGLCRKLLCIELRWRSQKGEKPCEDEYLARFAEYSDEVRTAFAECQEGLPVRSETDPNQSDTGDAFGEAGSLDETLTKDVDERHVTNRGLDDTDPMSIGRYRVINRLGKGGFAVIYRAVDEQLNREVAIKIPRFDRQLSDEKADLYIKEAQTLAALDDPRIVPVYDVGSAPGITCYVVSKLIEGRDLASQMKQRRLSSEQIVELIATVAEGLHYAHKQGFVHRDIKPANILIDAANRPYIADFGLALDDDNLGLGAEYCGTPSYMSPEQASGRGHRVDGRADVFSLGIVLYELLVGKRPFRSESTLELIEQISSMEAKPLRQIDDSISKQLEDVCLKALSKSANDRYATAQDFADALRGADSFEQSSHDVNERENATSLDKRRWLQIAGVSALVVLLFVLAFAALNGSKPDDAGVQTSGSESEGSDNPSSPDTQQHPATGALSLIEEFEIKAARGSDSFELIKDIAPLRNDDKVHFSIKLSEPAYVRLVWIDANGDPGELYPNDPEVGDLGDQAVTQIESPLQLDRGWPVEGEGGIETALLIVSREPLTDFDVSTLGLSLPDDTDMVTVERYVATKTQLISDRDRSLGSKSIQVDEVVLQLLEQIRTQADTIEAVAIRHVSDSD